MSSVPTIVVGLSGKIDSFVAAYLLKTQGLNVIGVAVQFFNPDDDLFKREKRSSVKDTYKDTEAVDDLSYIKEFRPECHIVDLEKVRSVADHLEIPFYAVNAQYEFKDAVLDRVQAAGISGERLYPCQHCHSLLINILLAKAEILKADKIATGHYAKISTSKNEKVFNVCAANDWAVDQSLKLSMLSQAQLSKMILPLAEMRREEVIKVAASLGVQVDSSKSNEICLMSSPHLPEFVERTTPPELRKPGQIMCYEDDMLVRDHDGGHYFRIGEVPPPAIRNENASNPTANPEQKYVVVAKNLSNGQIFVADRANLKFKIFILTNFLHGPLMSITQKINAFVRFELQVELMPCTVLFQNNDNVLVELKEEVQSLLVEGTTVAIYDSKDRGAKLIGIGKVHQNLMLNDVFFKREQDKDTALITHKLELNKKIRF